MEQTPVLERIRVTENRDQTKQKRVSEDRKQACLATRRDQCGVLGFGVCYGRLIIATNLPIREVSPVDQGPKMAGKQHVAFNLDFQFPPSRLAWRIEFDVFYFYLCFYV